MGKQIAEAIAEGITDPHTRGANIIEIILLVLKLTVHATKNCFSLLFYVLSTIRSSSYMFGCFL